HNVRGRSQNCPGDKHQNQCENETYHGNTSLVLPISLVRCCRLARTSSFTNPTKQTERAAEVRPRPAPGAPASVRGYNSTRAVRAHPSSSTTAGTRPTVPEDVRCTLVHRTVMTLSRQRKIRQPGQADAGQGQPAVVGRGPELGTAVGRPLIKHAVC